MFELFFEKSIFTSNLVQIVITLLAGATTYYSALVLNHTLISNKLLQAYQIKKIFEAIVILVLIFLSSIILMSFLYELGETYSYSEWYRRSFGPFGDGFPFALIMILNFGIYSKNRFLVITSISTILLCGGKMVIIASLINITILHKKAEIKFSATDTVKYLVVPLLIYFSTLAISNYLISDQTKIIVQDYFSATLNIGNKTLGIGACAKVKNCIETQINSATKQRLITTLAGAWMTLKGGFPGSRYPGTQEKFADFMISKNPYSLNETFNLDRTFWLKAKAIQNPYFNFGSGYGLIGFFSILFFYIATSINGYRLLDSTNKSSSNFLILFFISLALLNQTQPWIQAGSLLLYLSGISAAHIWASVMLRRKNV